MRDLLEDYIDNNKESFDSDFPSLKAWTDIERQLPPDKTIQKPKVSNSWKVMKIAAAVALLLVSGMAIGWHFGTSQNQIKSLADISPEMEEMEQFYQKQIESGKAQLVSLGYQDEDVFNDLDQLEAVFKDLKTEVSNSPSTRDEALINTLIENYKTRIAILERVFRKLKNDYSIEDSQKNGDEKTI